jgi:hypothetical protein
MTSRKTGRSPAASRAYEGAARSPSARIAPRPAGMSVARAVTKTAAKTVATAAAKPAAAPRTRGSYKVSSRTDQQRLAELKVKLGDPDYMEGAILRIATVLSARLTLR